jgi:hypothetical protein
MIEFLRAVPDQDVIYPYTLQQLQADVMIQSGGNTIISLAADPVAFEQEPFYLFQVYPTESPVIDLNTQTLNKIAEFDEFTQRWVVAWLTVDLSPEEIAARELANAPGPNWVGFYDAILISSIYQAVVQKGMLPGNTGLSTSIALLANTLTEANNGRPNVGALQASMSLVLMNAQPTAEEVTELHDLAVLYNLPPDLQQAILFFMP